VKREMRALHQRLFVAPTEGRCNG